MPLLGVEVRPAGGRPGLSRGGLRLGGPRRGRERPLEAGRDEEAEQDARARGCPGRRRAIGFSWMLPRKRLSSYRRRPPRRHGGLPGPVDLARRPISEWPSRMRQKGFDFGGPPPPRRGRSGVTGVGDDRHPRDGASEGGLRADDRSRRRALTVSELTERIQGVLETEFVDVWVEGEISNLKLASSGHWYFSLKDERAQVHAVVWKTDARLIRFRPQDGMKVLARGQLRVYPPRGEYQISIQVLEPLGKGSLQQAFEELKERLEKEGLFDPARKRPLPMLPRRIGVVTSPTGAVLRDILRVLRSRYANLEVLVYPALVQGEGAAAEIAQGIRALNRIGRPRRHRARPRRRQPRGPVGLQRGGRRPRDRGFPHPDHLGGGPRDRLHDRGLRGRPARPHAVGRRRARGAGQGGPPGEGRRPRGAPRRGAAPPARARPGPRRGRRRAPRLRRRAGPPARPGPARRRAGPPRRRRRSSGGSSAAASTPGACGSGSRPSASTGSSPPAASAWRGTPTG